MKLYFAGGEALFSVLVKGQAKNILVSFYYLQEMGVRSLKRFFASKNPEDYDVFLDCGAFSAWTLGKKIDLQQLINFIKFNEQYLTYVQLDDKNSDENTKNNLIEMRKAGLNPVPVYQRRMNDWDYFEKLCQESKYVAMGGMAKEGLSSEDSVRLLRRAVEIAKKYQTKLHTFGISNYTILKQVPIYSGDSTSWLQGGKTGGIMIFDERRRDLLDFSYKDKQLYRYQDYFEKVGVTYDSIQKNWVDRDLVNIYSTKLMEESLTKLYEDNKMRYWEEVPEVKLEKVPEVRQEIPKVKPIPPESTRGKIQEILQRPEVKEKWLAKMKGNLFALTTGAKARNLPYYCNDCYSKGKCPLYQKPKEVGDKVLCALHKDFKVWFSPNDFDYREEMIVNEARNRVINILLSRAGFNLWAEILDGGIQDKALTALLFGIYDRLANRPVIQATQYNINLEIATIINELDEESRRKIIAILREPRNEDK